MTTKEFGLCWRFPFTSCSWQNVVNSKSLYCNSRKLQVMIHNWRLLFLQLVQLYKATYDRLQALCNTNDWFKIIAMWTFDSSTVERTPRISQSRSLPVWRKVKDLCRIHCFDLPICVFAILKASDCFRSINRSSLSAAPLLEIDI